LSTAAAGADLLVERLARLDACAVSDAGDTVGTSGALSGLHRLWSCRPIAGRVVTVRLVPAEEAPARPGGTGGVPPTTAAGAARKVHLGAAAISAAGPGEVIVVDNRGRLDCGGWGGLLTTAACQKGIAGVVVYGACRDIGEAEELGFPVYGLGTTPRTARGRVAEEATGEPVEIAGVTVHTGDLVLADATGVVAIPAATAEAVITVAEGIVARETAMAERLRSGTAPEEVLGAAYEDMLRSGGRAGG
jgi:4-hydroxy-4-methyl-2-oxoglutarate aldolase